MKRETTPKLIEIEIPGLKTNIVARSGTPDIRVCKQIFLHKEYQFRYVRTPQIIIDAGAHIGIASIYFANLFPRARIIAIEPEKANFELLKLNSSYYKNITPLNFALWKENCIINLINSGNGNWGYMTHPKNKNINFCHEIGTITITEILDRFQVTEIDILKVDIEGAEKEVFEGSTPWINKVNSIIIELHERIKFGCNRSFYNGSKGFDMEWMQGENIFLSRKDTILPMY